MVKIWILMLCLMSQVTLVCTNTMAQEVVAATGRTYVTNSYQLDFTLGELIVDRYTSYGMTLNQGFHQGFEKSSSDHITLCGTHDVSIFPNPVDRILTIAFSEEPGSIIEISLHDETGRVVKKYRFIQQTWQLDLGMLAAGIYWLNFSSNDSQHHGIHKIVKY